MQGRTQGKLTFEEDLYLQAQHGNDHANTGAFVRARTHTSIEKYNVNLRSVGLSRQNIPFVCHQPKAWLYVSYVHTLGLLELIRTLLTRCSKKYMKNLGTRAWSSTFSSHFTEN